VSVAQAVQHKISMLQAMVVSERLKVRASLAKQGLRELLAKALQKSGNIQTNDVVGRL